VTTFADLRRALTPPTPADVAAALRNELAALAAEHAITTPGAWPSDADAARRLALDVCAEMHNSIAGSDTRTMLRLLRRGDAEVTRAVFGHDRDREIDDVADELVAHAEAMAAEWRLNMIGDAE
jgi:uncharacterized protein (DUF2267 family)